jgi:hypothetical protein
LVEEEGHPRSLLQAPTASELLHDPTVREALERAWIDSLPADPARRHEEGGWIYMDLTSGAISVARTPSGAQAMLDVTNPPVVPGSTVVATFHTHPNPTAEGWDPRPSVADTRSAWLLGVPCVIRTDAGVYTAGPESRRGGLAGGPGYPPQDV